MDTKGNATEMLIYGYIDEVRERFSRGEFKLKNLHEPRNAADALTFTFDTDDGLRLNVLMHDPVTVEIADMEGNPLEMETPPLLDAKLRHVGVCGIIGAQFKSPTHVARVIELEVPLDGSFVSVKITGRRG